MDQHISEIWAGLYAAGFPEVMLFLPDNSASRCHWNETAVIEGIRVALLADQDRKIVRVLPIDSCIGIGIASPKGTDPSGYKSVVQKKIFIKFGKGDGSAYVEEMEEADAPSTIATPAAASAAAMVAAAPPPPPPAFSPPPVAASAPAEPPPKVDPVLSRWGIAPKPAAR